ncbi:MAG TPA: hypothetical protein VH112_12975 [Acidimicrobiales bacterium]|nr:hypothetical protein [Acidimicrobiales bacterium]
MSGYQADRWFEFSVAVAGAGAALAGLLFVALSINLKDILEGNRLTERAAHTLILLGAALVIPLLVLIPGQGEQALGGELVAVGVLTGLFLAVLDRPWRRAPEQTLGSWAITIATPALALSLSAVLAGVGTITEMLGGLYWLPVGLIAAFVGALLNAWVLLVEILR